MMLSSAMLLDWLGTRHGDQRVADAAGRVEAGVRAAVRGGVSTRDLGGTASTGEFTDTVLRPRRRRGLSSRGDQVPGPPSTVSRRAARPTTPSAAAVAHSTPAEPIPAARSPTVVGMST